MSPSAAVVWHEVECGGYAGDLATWRELAAEAAGPVLELGCGAGRVTLDLAGAGEEVTGVDRRPELIEALRNRARAAELNVEAEVADARELALERRFALAIAPMQLVQLLGGASGRERMLERVRAHLLPGGRVAAALLAPGAAGGAAGATEPPLPDVREVDGWVYSSLPVEVRAIPAGVEVRRLRQTVSPAGELAEELDVTHLDDVGPEALEREAAGAGLLAAERIAVPPTADHVGSMIVILEAE